MIDINVVPPVVGNYTIDININPVAFTVGSVSVGWYGIMVALAVITMVTWALLSVRKDPRLNYDTIVNAAIVGIPSGVIFARLFHVIDQLVVAWIHPELVQSGAVINYFEHPLKIFSGSGLSIWGAVLGAALGIWIFNRFTKHSFAYMADMLAPGIILAQAIGRVGCTILGDDTGLPTSLPWGVVYTNPGSPTFQTMGLTPTQPVVTYEIIFNLIIFGVLLLLRKKLRPDGSLFMVYLFLYAAWRLGTDFLRTGEPFLFGLHEAQVISIIVLLIAIPWMAIKTRWVGKEENEKETIHA
jgi:phosphatidylglycerol:prolipoprotein diacylglycerol transferase